MTQEEIKNLILEAKENAFNKNCFTFKFGKYSIIIEKDYSMWQVTIGDTERLVQLPDDDTVNVFMRGKKIPTYFVSHRAFNLDGNYNTRRWCNDVVNVGAAEIASAIKEYEERLAAGHYDECIEIINKIASEAADYAEEWLFETETPADTSIEDLTIIFDGMIESSEEYILNRMNVSEDIQEILFEHYLCLIDKAIERGFLFGANRYKNAA